jgi:hypothetical protein
MDLLMTVGAKMVEEPYKLLVVDSIMALFRRVVMVVLVVLDPPARGEGSSICTHTGSEA